MKYVRGDDNAKRKLIHLQEVKSISEGELGRLLTYSSIHLFFLVPAFKRCFGEKSRKIHVKSSKQFMFDAAIWKVFLLLTLIT